MDFHALAEATGNPYRAKSQRKGVRVEKVIRIVQHGNLPESITQADKTDTTAHRV